MEIWFSKFACELTAMKKVTISSSEIKTRLAALLFGDFILESAKANRKPCIAPIIKRYLTQGVICVR